MKIYIQKLLLFSALGLLLSSCFDMPKEPTLPVWDVNVNVPIAGDTYTMAEILDTSTSEYLGIMNADGIDDSLYFLLVNDIDNTTKLQDSIRINPLMDPVNMHLVSGATGDEASIGFVVNPDADYHLIAATFTEGGFQFSLTNNTANGTDFRIEIPGMRYKTNADSVLTINARIEGNETLSRFVDISAFNYHELPVYEGAPLMPPYDYQNAEGFLVVVTSTATNDIDLTIETSTTEMSVSRMEGKIKRTELANISQTIETGLKSDIENFTDAIRLQNAKLTLGMQSFGEMANIAVVLKDVRIMGYMLDDNNNVVDSMALLFEGSETFTDSVIVGELFEKEFNQNNSNVVDFFLALPKLIKITNDVILAPVGEDNQVVSASDSIKVTASIFAPVIVSVKQASYDGEEEISLSDDDKDNLSNVKSAYVKIFVENEIPAYAKGHAVIVDENDNILLELHDLNGNSVFTIEPADVDNNGLPIAPKESTLSVAVNKDEITQIIDYGKKVKFSVAAFTTGSNDNEFGPFVRIKANYKISYRVSAGGVYHVDLEND